MENINVEHVQFNKGGTLEKSLNITEESLKPLLAREMAHIENNAEFFMNHFAVVEEESVEDEDNRKGVKVGDLELRKSFTWGIEICDFVTDDIDAWEINDIQDFVKAFEEIYKIRCNKISFTKAESTGRRGERGIEKVEGLLYIWTEQIGFLPFNWTHNPHGEYENDRDEIIISRDNRDGDQISISLQGEMKRKFIAKYGLICKHIMEIPRIRIEEDLIKQNLANRKINEERERIIAREEAPIYKALDKFLE